MALAGAVIFNQAKPEQWCIIWLKLKRQYDQAWATKQLKVKRQIAQVKRPHLAENPHCNTKSPAKQNKPLVAAPTINAQVSWAHVLQPKQKSFADSCEPLREQNLQKKTQNYYPKPWSLPCLVWIKGFTTLRDPAQRRTFTIANQLHDTLND